MSYQTVTAGRTWAGRGHKICTADTFLKHLAAPWKPSPTQLTLLWLKTSGRTWMLEPGRVGSSPGSLCSGLEPDHHNPGDAVPALSTHPGSRGRGKLDGEKKIKSKQNQQINFDDLLKNMKHTRKKERVKEVALFQTQNMTNSVTTINCFIFQVKTGKE